MVGGLLLQERDRGRIRVEDCQVVTQRRPSAEEYRALDFAWRICKHVKSNAIVLTGPDQIVGVGAGQMSRVDSAKIAVSRAQRLGAGDPRLGRWLGRLLSLSGWARCHGGGPGRRRSFSPVAACATPRVIAAADEHGMAMIFAGMRHFRH